MNACRVNPPWEFLLSASRNSLQSYELSRLSHAANLRKEISALVDQWIEENSSAMLARWLMEHRERESSLVESAGPGAHHVAAHQAAVQGTSAELSGLDFAEPRSGARTEAPRRESISASASDNFLPDFAAGRNHHHGRI
jgi:hypothetical protein